MGFNERDPSPQVRMAARLAIEQVGNYTLQVVEEGYETYEEREGQENPHSITVKVRSILEPLHLNAFD